MELLKGKNIADGILDKISFEIDELRKSGKRLPRLDMILVGDDYGSLKYVQMKEKVAKSVGIDGQIHHFHKDSDTGDILNTIDALNRFSDVDGFMVQLPLPDQVDKDAVLEKILPTKDVDGLTSVNLGRLFQRDRKAIAPATPLGIMYLLDAYKVKIFGKKVVILGRSNIVGTPLAAMMLDRNATVTVCNSHTVDVQEISRTADILISAVGKPLFVNSSFLKPGVVLIDVGSNRHPETDKLVGDVDWDDIQGIPSYVTPVPGGVGPMTIASLMLNLMHCYNEREGNNQ